MRTSFTTRHFATVIFSLALLGCVLAPAQTSYYGRKEMPGHANEQMPSLLTNVKISQRLNTQVPLDGMFKDETGKTVRLADYLGSRPAILALVYYNCQMLCSEELNGLVGALEMVKFNPGKDFNVIVVSIDPSETPTLAAKKKAYYLQRYDRPGTANGWHFLTAEQPPIHALAKAVGFGYVRVPGPDGKQSQFAHASAIQLLTPQGRISQYYLGVEYSPKDLQLGLVEASGNKIGSPVDNLLTYCYRYDPERNTHSLVIVRIVQGSCLLTMFGLGGYIGVMFRRDYKRDEDNGTKGNG